MKPTQEENGQIKTLPEAQQEEIRMAIDKDIPEAIIDMLKVSDCPDKMGVIRDLYEYNDTTLIPNVLAVSSYGVECMYTLIRAYHNGSRKAIPMMVKVAFAGASRMSFVRRHYV